MNSVLPHVALSMHAHDRHGLERTNDEWLDAKWKDPATRVLVLSGTRIRPVERQIVWVTPQEAPQDGLRILLGTRDEATHFAVVVEPDKAPGDKQEWHVLRALLPALEDDVLTAPLVMHAIGMAEWHWATRFCPRCGGPLDARQAGHVLECLGCGKQQFPRSDPAVIMIVTSGEAGSPEEMCLLGRSPAWPEGRFSTLAGFVEPGETMEDAVRREVAEETGIEVGEVTYFGSQPWPLPASLMVGFSARATSTDIQVDESEIAEARWFTREQIRDEAASRAVVLPGGISISRSLIEAWYGGSLPGHW
ncbi:MAG TPA: NAD(+) diphosphatase [Nocardioides sp.]